MTAQNWLRKRNSKRACIRRRSDLRVEQLEERYIPSVTALTPYISYHMAGAGLADVAGPVAYTPAQIRQAYGIDQINFGGIVGDGTGQTIAIVDAYDDPKFVDSNDPNFLNSDLHMFDEHFGLPDPPSFTKVAQDGSNNYPSTDPLDRWEGEESLDVEWAHAIAPGASIMLVEANGSLDNQIEMDNLIEAANYARQQPGVSVVSMSWGDPEAAFPGGAAFDNNFTTPAGHNGVTFLASTGDNGAAPNGVLGTQYPASSPNVVAVGGTTLTLNADNSYNSETGWNGSGGGVSHYEAEPAYQMGVQASGSRTTPDVSFDADGNTGVQVYNSYDAGNGGAWFRDGGTSLACPCWAGLVAIANQDRALAGLPSLDGPTQTLPTLYSLPAGDYHDITTGNNGYPAGPGYDLVTGIGTPGANLLVPDLAAAVIPVAAAPTVTAVTPNTGPYAGGTAVTITGTSFTAASTVKFGGTPATSVQFVSATSLIAVSPQYVPTGLVVGGSTVDITVTNAVGTSSITATDQFTYDPTAVIMTQSPSSGPWTGGTVVTFRGDNFAGPATVLFGNTPAQSVTVVSANTLTATTPPEPAGSVVAITIITPSGVAITGPIFGVLSFTYTALALPTVTAVAPTTGPTAGGTAVTITGTNFIPASAVDFGGVPAASVQFVSTTSLIAVSPAEPPATVDITVNNGAGVSSITAADQFTFEPPAVALAGYQVTVLGPNVVQAGTNFLLAVQAVDASGNPVAAYNGPAFVTASLSPANPAGNFPQQVFINNAGFGYFLADIRTAGAYTISVAGGGFGSNAAPVAVNPGPVARLIFGMEPPLSTPTGVVLAPVTVQVQDLYGNVITSDNADNVTISVGSGPGPFTAGSTTTVPTVNGVATFSNLTLVTPGNYTLDATIPALVNAVSTPFKMTPLEVLPGSFQGTPSGFSLRFNAPFLVNSVTPVLYGPGFGPAAPPPSVIVTTDPMNLNDTGAYVEGSLVLNQATNSITFVATNTAYENANGDPELPNGAYGVIVHSSAGKNGFQALNAGGGFLDGLGNGTAGSGDYTTIFKVNNPGVRDVVWVPSVAEGPGQPLEAPGNNQAGGGYPVYLSASAANVNKVQLTLNYDPTLLNVTGVTGPNFTLLANSTPGHANLQYSGPALPAGSQTPIGFVTAMVPLGSAANPTPYRAKDLLHLSGIALNGGGIASEGDDALHLVTYVGDADGNGSYSNSDAVLLTRVALQTDSGFAAYPLVDPVIVADTDGAGIIPADAALQVNEAGLGYATANLANPPIPAGVHFQVIANNVDPSVSLPSNLHLAADGMLTVPVNIDDPHPADSTGLIEAHLALTYDPRVFTVSAADVHLGSVLTASSGWTLVPTINGKTGEIAIALSSTTPIGPAIGGSLVTIDFHLTQGVRGEKSGVRDDRSAPPPDPSPLTPILLVASVNPTGQQLVTTELEDPVGTFTLTPAPSNSFDPRIDSVVTLTAIPAPTVVGTAALSAPVEFQVASRGIVEDDATANTGKPTVVVAREAPVETAGQEEAGRSAALANTQASAGGAMARNVDPLFQAMGRGINPGDVRLINTFRDAFERVLTGQGLQSPSTADRLDRLNWEEVWSVLDWQGVADSAARGASRGRDAAAHRFTLPPTGAQAVAQRAAMDQVFAQAADNINQFSEDE